MWIARSKPTESQSAELRLFQEEPVPLPGGIWHAEDGWGSPLPEKLYPEVTWESGPKPVFLIK